MGTMVRERWELRFCFSLSPQNELSILEFIHNIVETFDRYFESVVSSPFTLNILLAQLKYLLSLPSQCELDVSSRIICTLLCPKIVQ